MDIQVIGKSRHAPMAPRFDDLIGDLGTPAFPATIFSEVRRFCGCAHFVALASIEREPIQVIFATNEGPARVAYETAEKYVADHWRHDPINALLPKVGSEGISVRTTAQDIGFGQYRKDCYSRPRLTERLCFIRRRDGVTNRLNLYRARGMGSFSDLEINALSHVSDVLFALAKKHNELTRPAAARSRDDIEQRILRIAPNMPPREIDVCIGIARGQTSEAIALTLAVSVNTVLTYRKRAYARLLISSANELLRLVYDQREQMHGRHLPPME
jgi:DNA-binding CsgD family transcriptional regulator